MGLWDMVKDAALFAKCLTGWHAGEYTHIEGKPLCFFGKTCPDCGEYVTKKNHKFSEWQYKTYSNCDSERECVYCGLLESSVQHNYERQGKDSQCRIIEDCRRCGDKKYSGEEHNWITIPFTNKDLNVKGQRKCKDCGYMG